MRYSSQVLSLTSAFSAMVITYLSPMNSVLAIPLPDTSSCSAANSHCLKINNTSSGTGIVGQGATGVHGSGIIGVAGYSPTSGNGVYGSAANGNGVVGYSSNQYGVYGWTSGTDVAGVYGLADDSDGLQGKSRSSDHSGVAGFNEASGGIGVFGLTPSAGSGAAIYGESGNSGSSWAGFFAGRVRATQYVTASDRRLKSNVRDSPYGIREVSRFRSVTYTWKEGASDQRRQLGLIAQEVQETVPELVDADAKSGMLSVNYQALGPVLIKALQEQQAMIKNQEARIAALEKTKPPLLSSNVTALGLCVLLAGAVVALRRRRLA